LWLCGVVIIAAALLNFYDDGSKGKSHNNILVVVVKWRHMSFSLRLTERTFSKKQFCKGALL
jgi:hypothetical protein